ncbi:hypothetical protein Vretifemale_11606, partial [Volvox reticuliferus]
VLSAADAVGPSNCAACDAPVAAASGGSNGSSWRQRPVSRRQRRSKHLRTTTFSIFHYDILCTGETRATRTIDMYDAREHGGRGDTSDISCTGAGAVMPAAAVMAEEDRSGAHSLFGYTVEVDHDYDSSSARAANYDGDVVSYNSLLLRRVSSSVIERAAALSAAAATVTSTSSPVEFVASVGADPPAAEGSLIPSGEPTEAQRPAIDPRIAFVHDEGIDNTTAAAAAAMAVALRGDGGDVSPFTSLAATAAAIDYDTTGGAADPFVLTSLPNPVLIPCAFVPPASSTPPPRGHHQHHHREQQQEVLVAGEVGRRTVGGEGAVRLNGGMMPEVVRQQQRQAVANDPPSVDGAVSRMSPHDVAQQQHYRSSVDFEQRQFDSVATLHGGGGTGSDSGRAGVLVSPPPQHQIHPPYNNPRPRHVDNTAGARSPITNGLRRSGTGSAEAPSGSTLSYNYSEVLVPLPVPLPRAEILQPAATYADPTGPMIAPFLDVGSATSLFSSARLPRIAASLTAAPLRLSFTSHTGLVSEASAGTGTGAAPAAAPTTSPTVEVRHRGCGLGAASCTAATRPPSARAPRGTTVVRAGEPLSLLTGQLLQPANTLDPVAVQTAAASAAAPTALAAATTAGGMMAAAHGVPATGRFSPAAASRHRAVQDSAVDITVPIMPGSLDLASMVSGLQRGPEYGQHMQDMAVPLLAWLCRAGRPVAAGTVLRGLIQHRGMRFVDVCAEVRRQPQYDGMSFLHLAVQSGSRAMLAAVAEWQQTYGSVLAWDELCTVGLAPVHLAAALAVTRASEPETLDGRAADAMTDPRVGGGVSGGSDGGRGSTLNEAGLATLTWLLQHYPAVRGMWSTALDAYGSTPGAILSFQLAGLTPDAADRVRSALLPLVGPEEVWCKSVLAAPSGSGSSGLGDCGDGAAARQLLGDGLWGRVAATLEHWLAAVRRPPLPLVPTDTAGSTSMARNEPGGTVVALLVAAVLWLLLCSVL